MADTKRTVSLLLFDIVSHAKKAVEFCSRMDKEEFLRDEKTQFATVRCLSIIGEAVSRLPIDYRSLHDSIPWTSIIGMRNRLVHEYIDVDVDLCWETIQHNLPELIDAIQRLPEAADLRT